MKNFIGGLIIGLLIGGLTTYFIMKKSFVEVDVPIKIEVPVPVKDSVFDPIEAPIPVLVKKEVVQNPINKELLEELKTANSVIDSLTTLKEFVVKRTYKEIFSDSLQDITVDAETTGTLDKLQVSYQTKPYTISLDTTVAVPIPVQAELYVGGSVLLPFEETSLKPSLKASIQLVNKKHNKVWSVQYDPINKTGEIGLNFRL